MNTRRFALPAMALFQKDPFKTFQDIGSKEASQEGPKIVAAPTLVLWVLLAQLIGGNWQRGPDRWLGDSVFHWVSFPKYHIYL